MLKKTLFQLHWFFGITAGLILSIIGVTGALYSYDQQILKWFNQDSYVVQVADSPKLTPDQIYQKLLTKDPELQINSITMMQAPDASSIVNIKKEGERKGLDLMINPYTGDTLPQVQGKEVFQFILRLHRNLTLGPVGTQITGACALMLIYFVLSGIYLRWPKKHTLKQWVFIKPKLKGRNFIWDLHAVVGTWVIVFYLLFAVTGLYWSYDWWRDGMFKVMGVDRPQPMQMMQGKGSHDGEHQHKISNDDVTQALYKTWNGFSQSYPNGFSSLTLTIPKKNNNQVDLTFVDPSPQHERARNTATYDYATNKIDALKKYEDKKLNEKIMTSMLPVHRGSFFGPIWQFIAMLASLAMPLFFVTGILLYLKRRKQKKLTAQAKQSHIVLPNSSTSKDAWLIVYASQTGTAEQIAWHTSASLQEKQQFVTVKAIHKIDATDLSNHSRILFIISTYGTGDAPDLATGFVKKIMTQKLDLSHLNYAVLALGSKEYVDSYCQFGHMVNEWLKQQNALPFFQPIEVDNLDPNAIELWYTSLAQSTQLDLNIVEEDIHFENCTLLSKKHSNPESQGAPIYLLNFDIPTDMTWKAGDIAETQPMNTRVHIQAFLSENNLDINNEKFYSLLADKDLKHFSTDKQLEDLPTLPTREYSIASIPEQGYLQLVVRLHSSTEEPFEYGLGSGWLCKYTDIGSKVALRIRTNENFHLIADNRPIILIGNGTGIAGLMSLLQQRKQLNYKNNWLIFGERQKGKDFTYQAELENLQSMDYLVHLDLAFSRDADNGYYVQHKLKHQALELKKWVSEGAIIYVCGSINTMAREVDEMLIHILGEELVDELRETDRYKRDVY